jgi:hypothetical protein
MRLADLIGDVTTVDDVLGVMRALEAALPANDGVRWFNLLYLRVTEAVKADAALWQDWPFLQRFDVAFAKLYFDAILAWERDPTEPPHAWRPLLQARHDAKLARVQFALAGMSAHINHDLVVTLDRVAQSEGRFPARDGPRHSDFRRVNDILERVEASLRSVLSTGLVGAIDVALGDLDSILVMWNVRKAREAAWTNGEVVWHLREAPDLRRDFLARLDHMVGFAGRGLLVPRLELPEEFRVQSG